MDLEGHRKALALTNAGLGSACEQLDALKQECRRLRGELARARAFQVALANRCAAQSECLTRHAERGAAAAELRAAARPFAEYGATILKPFSDVPDAVMLPVMWNFTTGDWRRFVKAFGGDDATPRERGDGGGGGLGAAAGGPPGGADDARRRPVPRVD